MDPTIVEPLWSASRIANLIDAHRLRRPGVSVAAFIAADAQDATAPVGRTVDDSNLLHRLTLLDHHEFVDNAFRVLLGRPPNLRESAQLLADLLNGEAKTWCLGKIRYSAEGRIRGVVVAGLRQRYLAQRLFRLPLVGSVFEWLNAILRLPRSLRHIRSVSQLAAGNLLDIKQALSADRAAFDTLRDRLAADSEAIARSKSWEVVVEGEVEQLMQELAAMKAHVDALRSRLDALLPPPLGETLDIEGTPLAEPARRSVNVLEGVAKSELSWHERYAVFEAAFYDSGVVSAKQRVYIPFLDRQLTSRYPFLDLGCGRGEFLRILDSEGIRSVGVDFNPVGLAGVRAAGFRVVEQDILEFLSTSRDTFGGASVLQVAEHLSAERIERMLTLLSTRLAPGAPLIVETPNPLSPFALGHFYTDPTHIAPIPPERLRFAIEVAGFERTRTLFQARVPEGLFLGSDPRAYYKDYAIVAYRSAT